MYIITLQQALETVAQCKVTLKYTVSQEKQDTELLPITSPNINQFSKKNFTDGIGSKFATNSC